MCIHYVYATFIQYYPYILFSVGTCTFYYQFVHTPIKFLFTMFVIYPHCVSIPNQALNFLCDLIVFSQSYADYACSSVILFVYLLDYHSDMIVYFVESQLNCSLIVESNGPVICFMLFTAGDVIYTYSVCNYIILLCTYVGRYKIEDA